MKIINRTTSALINRTVATCRDFNNWYCIASIIVLYLKMHSINYNNKTKYVFNFSLFFWFFILGFGDIVAFYGILWDVGVDWKWK
jgi:hypothetical protein